MDIGKIEEMYRDIGDYHLGYKSLSKEDIRALLVEFYKLKNK